MRLIHGWGWVFILTIALWGSALAYSSVTGRAMYGDGAYYILVHLQNPHRFNDYDFQRSFASFISQAPVLFAQRIGLQTVAAYAALYSVGAFVFPAIALLAALFLSRRRPLMFAANAVAIIIYGFGTNFINTEANLLFGLVWLSVTIMALDRGAPILRGAVLPLAAFVLLRTYEGMLLVGPLLALWATFSLGRTASDRERFGLGLSALLFVLATVIGFGGFLAPRDPANASRFLNGAFRYLRNPQLFLLLAAMFAFPAIWFPARRLRMICAVLSAICGLAFIVAMTRLEGFYAYDVYYHNRSFMVLALPVFVGLLLVTYRFRPHWLDNGSPDGYGILLVPLSFAVAGDVYGTFKWNGYVREFCAVLEKDMRPSARLEALKQSGSQTAWAWTHPTMSVLLRDKGSKAMVTNDASQRWEPFDPAAAPSIDYRGVCQAPLLGPKRVDSFELPVSFAGGTYPSYVSAIRGISNPEGWATWSTGPLVDIQFARELPRSFDLTIKVGSAFGSNKRLPIKVRAGNREKSFVVDHEPYEITLQFRDAGVASMLSIAIPKPESPLELGVGNDPRKLGIALISLEVAPK